jgi:hypothetical protein
VLETTSPAVDFQGGHNLWVAWLPAALNPVFHLPNAKTRLPPLYILLTSPTNTSILEIRISLHTINAHRTFKMNSPSRRTICLSVVLFAFIAVTFYKLSSGQHCSFNTAAEGHCTAYVMNDDDGMLPNPPLPPFPDLDIEPSERLQSLNLGRSNTVMCWPSVGGIIAAEHVQSVELDFLGLDRFNAVNRTYNLVEDEFCRRLRLVGGKWWSSYWDFFDATQDRARKLTPEEEEVLYLGWPKSDGVWVLRLPDQNTFWYGFDRAKNAHTMEERCTALEMSGATFFENPEDCVYVKPLLDRFGEDKPPPPEHGSEI